MTLSDDSKVHFDVASLDIGSRTRGVHNDGPGPVPGVEQYTIPTRPISHLVQRIANAEKALLAAPGGHHSASINVVIVGGGAAGIELAFAMRARWAKHFGSDFTVTLLDAGSALLPHESSACQKVTNDALASRNISVIHKCHVAEITASHVVLVEDLPPVKYSHVIWATGAQSHPLAEKLRERGLAVDDRGWICVNRHLQSTSHPSLFAAGDCCTITDPGFKPPPKAGVYAVRSGPILIQNLVARFTGKPLVEYKPQDDFLKLLMCGDGTAFGFRFGLGLKGKWVWEMKNHIDQVH
jgi:selenide,water dikinase